MGKVENLVGGNGIAADRTGAVPEGGYKAVAFARLAIVHGELRIDGERPGVFVVGGADGDIAQADIGGVVEQHVAMDASEAPEVLVFQIGAVAVLVDLDGYLVLTFLDVAGNIEL